MGGVGPMAENYLTASFVTVWRKRAFWLACLFVAELFTFTALSHFDEAINRVVVLALFVPLCISTGGNSGSQAATLITRAMALGQVSLGDWMRVLRHELLMGFVLGITLGGIGFVRGSFTPEDVRGNIKKSDEPFSIIVPPDKAGEVKEQGPKDRLQFPKGVVQEAKIESSATVILPDGDHFKKRNNPAGDTIYEFPANTSIRTEAVDRWQLAKVIGLSVASICLWGTLVGSMLPLVFRRIGVDPGIASSPFVATFVDVTGIVIYFKIANIWLLN
jgi:magnesium transporter